MVCIKPKERIRTLLMSNHNIMLDRFIFYKAIRCKQFPSKVDSSKEKVISVDNTGAQDHLGAEE